MKCGSSSRLSLEGTLKDYMLSLVLSLFQGMTIKPLVELLDVKRKKRALPTVSEEIHSRVRTTAPTASCWAAIRALRNTVYTAYVLLQYIDVLRCNKSNYPMNERNVDKITSVYNILAP